MEISRLRRFWTIGGPVAAVTVWGLSATAHLLAAVPSILRYELVAAVAALLAAGTLYKAIDSIRRDRLIADTPLVKIRAAAQGYVKVFGRAKAAGDGSSAAPLSSRACVWWSYTIEERIRYSGKEDSWHQVDSATSVEPFVLADADAECLVGPVNADITPTTHDVWYGDTPRPNSPPGLGKSFLERRDYRYTERLLKVGEQLSVTGELRSKSELDRTDAAAELLHQWKLDQKTLLARFDRNHDGSLDAAEWEAARRAAAAEAHAGMLKAPVARVSVIGQPIHGEPFLIAPMDADRLVRREKWHAILFLALGLGCAVGCALALERASALASPLRP